MLSDLDFTGPEPWTFLFSHSEVSKKLLTHYVKGTGTPIELSESEMAAVRVKIDLRQVPEFAKLVAQLGPDNLCVAFPNMTSLQWAGEPMTLYRFVGRFSGEVCGCSKSNWEFHGTVNLEFS
jgi:hypothetical protein